MAQNTLERKESHVHTNTGVLRPSTSTSTSTPPTKGTGAMQQQQQHTTAAIICVPIKSKNDRRLYRVVELLTNKLQVMLISDECTDKVGLNLWAHRTKPRFWSMRFYVMCVQGIETNMFASYNTHTHTHTHICRRQHQCM